MLFLSLNLNLFFPTYHLPPNYLMLPHLTEQATWLATATEIAREAGELVMGYYRAEVVVHTKGGDARNLVTDADLAADEAIHRALHATFPDHARLSEEAYQPGDTLDDDTPTWVIDPIDGTSNFAHRLPFFAISIGLHHAGQPLVGVVHAPALDWTFAAARGHGATFNSLPLAVSQRAILSEAIVACDWSRHPPLRRQVLAAHSALAEQAHTMRSLGSAALGLAAVAAGWVDIYFNFSLYPWDTVAGALLLHEAGGRLTALDGTPWRAFTPSILASNSALHPAALDVLTPHLPTPES